MNGYDRTGEYKPFEGMCFVDTFELAEKQARLPFAEENAQRVERQRRSPIFVVLGNPPYNAWQQDENDGNKNRGYPVLDGRVADTYAKSSRATLKNSLSDPYVKAFRWASDRIGNEGIVAFVTNNGFIDGLACDGVRKHLAEDFDSIYLLDLGGNVRKNPKLSGTIHNVFGIQVGVSIGLFVRRKHSAASPRNATVVHWSADEYWRKEDKYRFLDDTGSLDAVKWRTIRPNAQHTWLTDGLHDEYGRFLPLVADITPGESEPKAIFAISSNGVQSNNDAYVYGFDRAQLSARAAQMVDAYNSELARARTVAHRRGEYAPIVDEKILKWVRKTKRYLARQEPARVSDAAIVSAAYRPFANEWLFFDPMFNEDLYRLPRIFTSSRTPVCICLSDAGSEKPFMALATNGVPDRHLVGAGSTTRVLPLTMGDGDDNITGWALAQFRKRYDEGIAKVDIFHYAYAMLHHPTYRQRYAANLKRELPRLPYAADFWAFARAGKTLVDLHTNYEKQREYPLRRVEMPGEKLNWRVLRMRLTKDRQGVVYNDFLTLAGLPPEVFDYRLGNRSALEWLVDQYQISTDSRSGITNDPNRPDDPQYIVRLIGQIVTLSLETIKIVNGLPALAAEEARPSVRKASKQESVSPPALVPRAKSLVPGEKPGSARAKKRPKRSVS